MIYRVEETIKYKIMVDGREKMALAREIGKGDFKLTIQVPDIGELFIELSLAEIIMLQSLLRKAEYN